MEAAQVIVQESFCVCSQVSYHALLKQWKKTSSLSIDVIENLDYVNGVNKTN